jgi:hypothetical protein
LPHKFEKFGPKPFGEGSPVSLGTVRLDFSFLDYCDLLQGIFETREYRKEAYGFAGYSMEQVSVES